MVNKPGIVVARALLDSSDMPSNQALRIIIDRYRCIDRCIDRCIRFCRYIIINHSTSMYRRRYCIYSCHPQDKQVRSRD